MSDLSDIRNALADLQESAGYTRGLLESMADTIKDRGTRLDKVEGRLHKIERRVNVFHGVFVAVGALLGYNVKGHIG